MAESSADKLTAVVNGENRYGIELDAALRTIAATLPAVACLRWFASISDSALTFRQEVLSMLEGVSKIEQSYQIQFEDESAPEPVEDEQGFTVAIRLRFINSDAAYYQFEVFPPELEYVLGWSRKRNEDSQLMLLTLRSSECMDDFVAVCRSNPHFIGIETITEDEFWKARCDRV